MPEMPSITIYTDGACTGNPGPGGYAALVMADGNTREICGGFALTTNNRMELMAALEALRSLAQPSQVLLYSDSKYLVDAVQRGWAKQWRANRWRNASRRKVENIDLWSALLDLLDVHQVTFRWVEGHAGNPHNARCDRLACRQAERPYLPPDPGYAVETQPGLF